ncbi:MAG: Bug family tripartite tricarboxylate transporter substrate binding protein [Deinococcales bacterium]
MRKRVLFGLGLTAMIAGFGALAQVGGLKIIAPAAPGGGWDQTARSIQSVLESTKLATGVQVSNVPGAGGTVGLAQLVNAKGDGNQLMVMGLVMVGAIQTNKSRANLDMVTPIARLTGEFQALVVPAGSKIQNMTDFMAAWKANPSGTPIAGGSAGGTDHITVGLLAKNGGVDMSKVNYVPYAGGGEALASLLGNQVAAGVSSLSEFLPQVEAGKLRLLGISSAKRINGVNAPTFKEQKVNVEIANWRGIVAPLGISENRRQELVGLMDKMSATPAWKETLKQKGWTDLYQSGSKFEVFLKLESEKIVKTLRDIGILK